MLGYLTEIRRRCLYVIALFCGLFLLFYLFSSSLFTYILQPLLVNLNGSSNLIATSVTGPVFAQIKIAFNFSIIAILPFVFFQAWSFAYPALKLHESKGVLKIFAASLLLFLSGIIFTYFLVLPCIFNFLCRVVPKGITLMPDINYTLDFINRMLLVFGICFQLPLITRILVQTKLISVANLKVFRPYFIVFAFTIGMLLTPPDVFSQIMLAMPMVILFEISILLANRPTKIAK